MSAAAVGEILHRKGSLVCCVNDHPMYRLTRDVRKGDMILPVQYEPVDLERIGTPKPLARFQDCPECGAPWGGRCGPFNVKESEDR